jgi:hypothetical protein
MGRMDLPLLRADNLKEASKDHPPHNAEPIRVERGEPPT